jgi:hypothetical protein
MERPQEAWHKRSGSRVCVRHGTEILQSSEFRLPTNYLSSPLFGQATQMLGSSLGTGGLNPLYQLGGPRSAQLTLKLAF